MGEGSHGFEPRQRGNEREGERERKKRGRKMAERFEADMRSRFHPTYHHRPRLYKKQFIIDERTFTGAPARGYVRRRNDQRNPEEAYKNKMMEYREKRKVQTIKRRGQVE